MNFLIVLLIFSYVYEKVLIDKEKWILCAIL